MTEGEWLACTSPERMLRYLWATASDRKLRLFAVACARRVAHLSTSGFWQREGKPEIGLRLAVAERFADGLGSVEELEASWDAGLNVRVIGAAPVAWRSEDYAEAAAGDACGSHAPDAALWAMLNAQSAADPDAMENQSGDLTESTEHRPQVSLLRDIFGNPFRPIVAEPAWLTPTVQSIATAIYQDRAFDRLPILADALEEAGCTNADVLLHCRQPGEHVRGCWVVDLVLGKK